MVATLERLVKWYMEQCNGDWEHQFGIRIDTLDNPGWSITVDLVGTPLEHRNFLDRTEGDSDSPSGWISLKKKDGQFLGYCEPRRLDDVLKAFLAWAER